MHILLQLPRHDKKHERTNSTVVKNGNGLTVDSDTSEEVKTQSDVLSLRQIVLIMCDVYKLCDDVGFCSSDPSSLTQQYLLFHKVVVVKIKPAVSFI